MENRTQNDIAYTKNMIFRIEWGIENECNINDEGSVSKIVVQERMWCKKLKSFQTWMR